MFFCQQAAHSSNICCQLKNEDKTATGYHRMGKHLIPLFYHSRISQFVTDICTWWVLTFDYFNLGFEDVSYGGGLCYCLSLVEGDKPTIIMCWKQPKGKP